VHKRLCSLPMLRREMPVPRRRRKWVRICRSRDHGTVRKGLANRHLPVRAHVRCRRSRTQSRRYAEIADMAGRRCSSIASPSCCLHYLSKRTSDRATDGMISVREARSAVAPIRNGHQAADVMVESRMGAVAWGLWPALRFPSPLIEPDVPVSGIRLSDWLHR
jgi:hypothetical protein